jgi:hypothetical protein
VQREENNGETRKQYNAALTVIVGDKKKCKVKCGQIRNQDECDRIHNPQNEKEENGKPFSRDEKRDKGNASERNM